LLIQLKIIIVGVPGAGKDTQVHDIPLSAVCCLLSAVCCLLSAVYLLLPDVNGLLSAAYIFIFFYKDFVTGGQDSV
jgi:hypothetical protein